MYRIGQGFDVHAFAAGRKLVLCGEHLDHALGLQGHSDADVALHAVMDALLGALALGDIGGLFPDTDRRYKDADSSKLLASLLAMPECSAWKLINLDLTIIAEQPKIAPYAEKMRKNLAKVFDCALAQISVKATTTEKLGFTGRGEGIAASCVCLLGREIRDADFGRSTMD